MAPKNEPTTDEVDQEWTTPFGTYTKLAGKPTTFAADPAIPTPRKMKSKRKYLGG